MDAVSQQEVAVSEETTAEPKPSGEGTTPAQKRTRGAFPRVPLRRTLELPEAVFRLGDGEPVRRLHVFDHLKKKPDSGPSRTLVTASTSGYGLTTGGTGADYLGLTDRGRVIVAPASEQAKRRAFLDALFENDIFSSFVARYGDRGVPNDQIAIDYFKVTHKLSDPDAQSVWAVIKENLSDCDLLQELSGRKTVVKREAAYESLERLLPPEATDLSQPYASEPDVAVIRPAASSREAPATPPRVTGPDFHFNIQIHLPDSASPEVYDSIFRSIAIHLLRHREE
jgi:hypothetical protein